MIWLWCTRVTWALLPVTTGTALADATSAWSSAPAPVAAALLWITWAVGLAALFAPRPWGLTLLRIAAPGAYVCVLVSCAATSAGAAVLAVGGGAAALVLALSAPVAAATANALAYGDEERFSLRMPLPLLFGPLPLAVALATAGAAGGPLLLADGRYVVGALATIVGLPVVALVARALHPLSCRWLVLVPAGVAIADPLTLTEPVLVRREHIARMRRTGSSALGPGALDLRLGTLAGGVVLDLSEPVEFGRRQGRRDAQIVDAAAIAVAVVRPDAAIARARRARINA